MYSNDVLLTVVWLSLMSLLLLLLIKTPKQTSELDSTMHQCDCSVFKTVAHIDPNSIHNATRIYVDYENDVAVYMYNNPNQKVLNGSTVTTTFDAKGVVVSIVATGFIVDFGNSEVTGGMSGMPVMFEGNTVGYISSIQGSNFVYCIWS